MAGLADFDLYTEQYWVLSDAYIDVLATTTQKRRPGDPWHREVTSPAIWTRQWGAGRIFVITAGHSLDVLDHPSVDHPTRPDLGKPLTASRPIRRSLSILPSVRCSIDTGHRYRFVRS